MEITVWYCVWQGWMETTLMFYGSYADRELLVTSDWFTYHFNMPLAYLLTVVAYFLVSLAFIVRK